MQIVERHGGGSHFVRPDRVYRTGVISSAMGYEPGSDVDQVAASFTQYPMDLQTLQGLGRMGLFDRLRMRYRAWKMKQALRGLRGLRDFTPTPMDPARGIAYPQVGREIAPHLIGMQQMAQQMMADGVPSDTAYAQAATSMQRWWNSRWNG